MAGELCILVTAGTQFLRNIWGFLNFAKILSNSALVDHALVYSHLVYTVIVLVLNKIANG